MTYKIETILEYSAFFPERDFSEFKVDIILKKYSREKLIKAVNVLSMNYENAYIPNSLQTFFSHYTSQALLRDIAGHVDKYLNNKHCKKVCFCTRRTILELLRRIYNIPPTDFENNGIPDFFDYDLFCVILYINEVLMKFNSYKESDPIHFQTLIYLGNYIHNDFTNVNFKRVLITQIYYFNQLKSFLDVCEKAQNLKRKVLEKLSIESLDEFIYTVTAIIAFFVENKPSSNGYQMLYLDRFKAANINKGICEYLSIGKDEVFFTEDIDVQGSSSQDLNTDYKIFRSHPLIKIDEGCYLVYSLPILCERLYNGFVFDLLSVFTEGEFFSFYNKYFVERYLFHNAVNTCLGKHVAFSFPPKIDINEIEHEQEKQPDFYIRDKYKLILFECKSIKIGSSIKEHADVEELAGLLYNKLYESRINIDKSRKKKIKPSPVGVRQLLNSINDIEDSNFTFDNSIPDEVAYYPVLVLDDPLVIQLGLTNLVNHWFFERVREELKDSICHPLIVMSIDTLALYSDTFKEKGFTFIFDKFFSENVSYAKDGQVSTVGSIMDFNVFMQSHYHPNKKLLNNTIENLCKLAKARIYLD